MTMWPHAGYRCGATTPRYSAAWLEQFYAVQMSSVPMPLTLPRRSRPYPSASKMTFAAHQVGPPQIALPMKDLGSPSCQIVEGFRELCIVRLFAKKSTEWRGEVADDGSRFKGFGAACTIASKAPSVPNTKLSCKLSWRHLSVRLPRVQRSEAKARHAWGRVDPTKLLETLSAFRRLGLYRLSGWPDRLVKSSTTSFDTRRALEFVLS
jgi:hypothetical protein